MSKTHHMHKRMSQRAINEVMVELTKTFGIEDGDKVIVNQKGIEAALQVLEKWKQNFMKMRSRGGMVLVESDNVEITAYRLEKNKRH